MRRHVFPTAPSPTTTHLQVHGVSDEDQGRGWEAEGWTYLIVATTMVEGERADDSYKGVGGGDDARTGSEGSNVVFDSGVETVTESRGRPLGTK